MHVNVNMYNMHMYTKCWHKASLSKGQMMGYTLFQGEIRLKMHCQLFKILVSRTTRSISIKLSKEYSWVKGIQFFFFRNKGSSFSQNAFIQCTGIMIDLASLCTARNCSCEHCGPWAF